MNSSLRCLTVHTNIIIFVISSVSSTESQNTGQKYALYINTNSIYAVWRAVIWYRNSRVLRLIPLHSVLSPAIDN